VGYAVVQLFETLCYKPECHGLDSRWGHWVSHWLNPFGQHFGPGADSASNRNEYKRCILGVKGSQCI